jgi:hypothetical protein
MSEPMSVSAAHKCFMSKKFTQNRISKNDRLLAAEIALFFLPMADNQSTLLQFTVGTIVMSTGVNTDATGKVTVEVPEAMLSVMVAWSSGETVTVIARSFDLGTVACHAPNGHPIPYKTLRAWIFVGDGSVRPFSADEVRLAYSFDAVTGKPVELDPSEIFADAWELSSNPHGGQFSNQ